MAKARQRSEARSPAPSHASGPARSAGPVRLLGVTGRTRADLLLGTALQATTVLVLSLPFWTSTAAAQPAPNAMPTGGSVVAGSATITQSPNTTAITQTTPRAAIDWRSFNVGSQQLVTFAQPSSSAVALNRVTGPDPSQIAGKIIANGQVVLVNQAGVTFYKGAQVNAQSLIVSSADIANGAFMAGNMTFDQAGNPNARVVNQGTITVKQAGLAALVAPSVANSGVINARLGHVVLAGVKTATLDLYGDGLLALDVSNQVTQAPVGPDGKPVAALVTNSGVIRANGGTVQLTAMAADGVVANLVRAGGKIVANSSGARTGSVTVAGIGGSVTVTGLVSAAGKAAGTTGGDVTVNATAAVTLASKSRIDASGAAGGGTVAIGTTLQRAMGGPGTPATLTAANVTVRKGATINASAGTTGNGGRVTVLSTGTTRMNGTITATGGGLTGNGGFVEVSGDTLGLTGSIAVSAPNGLMGTILLDPTDLAIIGNSGENSSSIDAFVVDGTLLATAPDGTPLPSTVFATTLENMSGGANIVVQATGTIDVRAPLTVLNGLTLLAGGNLTVEAGAPLQATGNIVLQAGTSTPSGALVINDSVTAIGGVAQLIAGTGGITLNGNISATILDLNTTGGGVTQTGGTIFVNSQLMSSTGVTGTVSLLGANFIPTLASFTVTGGDFQLVDTFPLDVLGHVTASQGNVFLQETDPDGISIDITGGVVAPGGLASIRADALAILVGQANQAGFISAGTFEFAPDNPKFSMSIGLGAVNGVVLNGLAHIASTGVRIGNVTAPAALGVPEAANSISVVGAFDTLNRTLELDTRGAVDGTAGTLINVGSLSGTGAAWSLPLNNTIANLGNIAADSFELNDSVPLTVTGALVSAAGATITDLGLLTVDGTVSGTAVSLAADSMTIPGVVTDGGVGTVQLTANSGTISETGTLIAAVLTGSAAGVVDLLGASPSANAVAALGTSLPPPSTGIFSAASFALRDGIGLTVAGTAVATASGGQVFLSSTAPAGITILAGGAVLADALTGTASLQTDALLNNGAVTAAAIELAPATAGGTVTLGASGTGLSLLSMSGLSATDLTVGAVTQPGAALAVTTAGGIMIGGAFTFTGTGSLILDAASSTAIGASGVVQQTAALTDAAQLSGYANTFFLTNSGNAISTLVDMTATTGEVAVISGTALAAAGVSAPAGSVFLSSSSGGVSIEGAVSANQRVSVQTDDFTLEGGSVSAATFELAPETSGSTVTLGAATGGLVVSSLSGLSVATARLGAVTEPGEATPTVRAGAVTVAAPFDASSAATLELDATGPITQVAALTGVGTLTASAGSVVLGNAGNQIETSSGITATSGNIVLVDGESLALNGTYSGNDLFFEVAAAGGTLTLGGTGPATLSPAAGARISLVADGLSANTTGSIGTAGGTVELAPFSSVGVSLAGTGAGTTFTAALLSNINVGTGTLVVGGYTNLPAGGTALIPTAGSISLDGAVDLTGRAGTLVLLASGPVSEPGGPLTVGTVTGVSTGDFTLDNAANLIQVSGGIIANNGNVVLETDPTMLLTGTYTGANLFFEVTQAGGSLAVGNTIAAATLLVPTGGRISLVADTVSANSASNITAPTGTLEIAPFSATAESIQGAALGEVTNGLATLVVGGYTNPRAPLNGPAASAGAVVLDGPLDLTNLAENLRLLSLGPVTEPGGPLTVANVFGTSAGTFSLTNVANAIGQSTGIVASNGDVVVVNGGNLTLTGTYGGNNLFFEVAAQGGILTLGAANEDSAATLAILTAASGGRISLVADQVTAVTGDSLAAPGGTLELAPFSPLDISLLGSAIAGQFLIDPTLLASITPGFAELTIGGFTNVPAGGTVAAPSSASVTIGGSVSLGSLAATLNLEAVGAITQTAPLTGVGTLAATGSSVILANAGNQIGAGAGITATAGDVELVDGTSLALNGIYSGNNLFFEVAAKGGAMTIGGVAPATLSLTGTAAAGGRISLVADGLSANTTGSIGNAGGTVELAPFSPVDVSLAGSGGAGMTISPALLANIDVGAGTLVVGGFTPPGAATASPSASAITLDGAVNLSGHAGTLELLANGAITEPGGPLNVATVTGVAGGGDFSLSNPANQIQVSTEMTANNGNVVLVDDTSLQLVGGGIPVGPFTGKNLFFEVTQPGGTLAINGVLTATVGRASLVADTITAASQSLILAPGSVELAPYSAIDVSLGGSSAPGTLGLGATLLSSFVIRGGIKGEDIANDLVIGGYTNLPAGAATITTSAASITVDAPVNVHGALTLDLLANGSISEPNGSIIATNIQGSAGTSSTLTNPGNEIAGSLGITAAKGDVVLVDATDLTLTGTHSGDNLFFEVARQGGTLQSGTSDAAASLTAASGGRITLVADQITATAASTLSAPAGTLELAPFSAVNLSLAGSSASGQALIDPSVLSIITPGLSTLTVGGYTNVPAGATSSVASATSISIDGLVTVGPLATVLNFEATGAVTQSAPITNVGTLTGTTGSTTLSNSNNSVAVLGNYTANGGFALTDATGLSIAGLLAAGPSANVTVNGVLTESGGITAGQLSGGAAGTATLTGANNVGELNGFTVGGGASSLLFTPAGDLVIAGTVSANRIVISAPANQITLANGVNIVTGGSTRPTGTAPPPALLPANGGPGALLQAAGFTQVGRATVSSLGGGPSTLQVSVTGNIRFDGALGLSATGTWLILTLTNGSATGDVYVKALDVSYAPGGSANLFGSVQGVPGVTAAGLGFIQPALSARYTFNNCEIGSAACLLAVRSTQPLATGTTQPLLTETSMFVPVDALLALVTPALILDPQDNDDLLESPVVSREDY